MNYFSKEEITKKLAYKPSYSKDKLDSFLFMIKLLFVKDWAMPHLHCLFQGW